MNSGCFDQEFKDVLASIQYVDYKGIVKTISANKVNFNYRSTDLPQDIIFLSATFKGTNKKKNEIENYMNDLKTIKEKNQPTRIKTSGSTFKNPKDQTNIKAWKLIKDSVPNKIHFGDAKISEKHANFFVNKKNAKYEDMKSLIDYVKNKVKDKTGVDINLEIVIVD